MFKSQKLFFISLITLFLSGCAVLDAIIPKVEMPKNPNAFRASVNTALASGSSLVVKKSYTVNKPHSYVVKQWKKRTPSCLKQSIKETTTHGGAIFGVTKVSFKDYTPTLKVKAKKAVLSIQMNHHGDGIGSNMITPPGGAYFMVLDATPLKGKKTRITVYRWNTLMSDFSVVSKPIVNWASGKSKACPDYQKIW